MLRLESYGAALPTTARAEILPDGRVAVRDVPIFSETRPDDPSVRSGARELRDRDWLAKCLEIHEARATDGHAPPLNLRHSFDAPQKVGTYRLRRIDLAKVNPQDLDERATIFGDEIFDSVDAFNLAKDHEHRSPEISPDWPDEFGPVALLREASPFNKYPNVKAEISADARALVEAFEARGGWIGQAWRRGHYESSPPSKKEGAMPAPDVKDKKDAGKSTPADERMEAMFSKFHEAMMGKFEELIGKIGKTDEPEKSEEKPDDEKAEEKPSEGYQPPKFAPDGKQKKAGEELKGPESHTTTTPEMSLPPAVSQAKSGEAFSARLAVLEKQNQELKSELNRQTRERAAEVYAAEAEKALVAAEVVVTDDLRARLKIEAVEGGKKAVEKFCSLAVLVAKSRPAAPTFEAFGVLQGGGTLAQGEPEDLKKAIETYGSTPAAKQAIRELYADFVTMPQSIKRFGFAPVVEGDPRVNPNATENVGGRRKA